MATGAPVRSRTLFAPRVLVAIGDENLRDALSGEPIENLLAGINGVDAEISFSIQEECSIEVVTVGLRKPRPAEHARQQLVHGPSLHPRPTSENPSDRGSQAPRHWLDLSWQLVTRDRTMPDAAANAAP